MKMQLQCRATNDTEWFILNTVTYPIGPTWFDIEQRKKAEKYMNQLHQGWSTYFNDHQFRVVRPKGF